jgi:hypothetical protein
MKRRLLVYQNQFEKLLRQRLATKKMPTAHDLVEKLLRVDIDENGEQILTDRERRAGAGRLPKQYIAVLTDVEQELMAEKTKILREQNRVHYQTKCLDLLDKAGDDSFSLAAATLMLNSDCEYLKGLRQKYASTLVKNPSALSNHLTKDLDKGLFDRSYENIIKSAGSTPARPEHIDATISSVSNDVSPPAPV